MVEFRCALVLSCLFLALTTPVHATECECGDTLTTDTILTADLLDCPEHGLTLDADGITLDGNGYRISGAGIGVGIKINGRDGVVVKNCEISDFEDGIKIRPGSERDSIGSNTIRDNTRYGIYSAGLWESTNGHSVISGNNIIDNDDSGIHFTYTHDDTIFDNVIMGNTEKGICIDGQQQTSRNSYNQVLGNEITGSNYGVYIGWAYGYQYVIGNTITDNSYGISIWSTGFWTTFSGNTIHRNALHGISAVGCFLLVMEDNDVQHNGQGFYVRGSGLSASSESRLVSNTIRNNVNNGIYLDRQSGDWELMDLAITGNDISDNLGYGLYVGSAGVTSDSIYGNEFAANVLGNAYEVTGVTGNMWHTDSTGNLWDDWVLNPGYPEGIYYVDGPGDGIDSLPGRTAGVPYSEEPAPATWGGIKSLFR
ncbi:nitrous oxide reductase family maturation protein NosD [Candidatus Eisenbacteria bacterium]|uniref:Nitrous oxide reductase family maturation protein NosD n=1 Tax=Eiseniibacteriota bacterium TaxID=2212470 RepID=A0ABV6YNG0_UNCEI